MNEVDKVVGHLKSLAERKYELPPVDDVYWQARVRGILNEEQRLKEDALRPLRWLHRGIGVVMTAAALAVAISPLMVRMGEIENVLPVAVIGLAGIGAYFLTGEVERQST